jgi:hypothetical protein
MIIEGNGRVRDLPTDARGDIEIEAGVLQLVVFPLFAILAFNWRIEPEPVEALALGVFDAGVGSDQGGMDPFRLKASEPLDITGSCRIQLASCLLGYC